MASGTFPPFSPFVGLPTPPPQNRSRLRGGREDVPEEKHQFLKICLARPCPRGADGEAPAPPRKPANHLHLDWKRSIKNSGPQGNEGNPIYYYSRCFFSRRKGPVGQSQGLFFAWEKIPSRATNLANVFFPPRQGRGDRKGAISATRKFSTFRLLNTTELKQSPLQSCGGEAFRGGGFWKKKINRKGNGGSREKSRLLALPAGRGRKRRGNKKRTKARGFFRGKKRKTFWKFAPFSAGKSQAGRNSGSSFLGLNFPGKFLFRAPAPLPRPVGPCLGGKNSSGTSFALNSENSPKPRPKKKTPAHRPPKTKYNQAPVFF